jgi:energy-coupling factor transporter ATP-binding protein EcfA2
MRLLVTGKTRSGKSTALHRILSHALRPPWTGVLLLDGKSSELSLVLKSWA